MFKELFKNTARPLFGLAPMAGVADSAMRAQCLNFGADYTVSEMVSAKALCMGDKKSLRLLKKGSHGGVYGIQLFAADAENAANAAEIISGEDFDFLDINMGCPAPKITGNGSGSALLLNPPLARQIVEAVVKVSKKPVSVKLRIGWDDARLSGGEVAKLCEEAGAAMLCVHSRTRKEQYGPVFHPEIVGQIKAAAKIPVIYNGNVIDGQSAQKLLRQTGCDGVAVGRAAMGSPWVFEDIVNYFEKSESLPQPPLNKKMRILDEQINAMCLHYGEDTAIRMGRGVAAQYMKGLRGASTLRRRAVTMRRYSDLAGLIEQVYYENEARKNNDFDGDEN